MTTIEEVEFRRARWRRALQPARLDKIDQDDFCTGGLSTRLRAPSVRLVLLPDDPEVERVTMDEGFWSWLTDISVVTIEGRSIRLGTQQVPSAHAAALVDSYGGNEAWNSYVAIHRSGAVEYGLGDSGAWKGNDRQGSPVRIFSLISVVARTWALMELGRALRERHKLAGPCQLTVGLHETGGAFLGNVAEGWAEPLSWGSPVHTCQDEHLLWHIELGEGSQSGEIAFMIGDRLEDAWGVRQRRYLARVGDYAGRLDVRQLQA